MNSTVAGGTQGHHLVEPSRNAAAVLALATFTIATLALAIALALALASLCKDQLVDVALKEIG